MKPLDSLPSIDRPREKLSAKGISALNEQELLMLLLGSGTKDKDVRSLAGDLARLLKAKNGDISIEDLNAVKGIGIAKASQIMAAFELAKRYTKPARQVRSAEDIVILAEDIREKKQEHFVSLTLNGASVLIEKREVFKGTVDMSIVHPREIFADAITDRAAAIAFVHNHPSGDPRPSLADKAITKRLVEAGELLGIKVLDHIIVTKDDYFSFQAHSLLNEE
ncbi:MAG: DNA repair protein RadC [Spirochaetaceae bacterium]|jgi:DNA repair protein RadC|nr:DNA repair protein RadC [Spirochaetaceae bacterium]